MMASLCFSSPLGPVILRYLELKQALGRRYDVEARVLHSLDRFLNTSRAADLDASSFAAWCHSQQHLCSGVLRSRMRIVRNFCLYQRRRQPDCFVPDPLLFPSNHQRVRPYIFSEEEIARLLSKTSLLTPSANSPLRPRIFRLAIVLLYTTGLRRGELLRLTLDDYDGQQIVLSIHASKFHKSRILPVPQDVAGEIEEYLQLRSRFLPSVSQSPLLCNRSRQGWRHYTGPGLSNGIGQLLRLADIRKPDGRWPRVHDFRHSFAVNALLRWYRDGVDVGTRLPGLAAYMGHVSIVSTQYYLHLVEPLRTLASHRFAQSCGRIITSSEERTPQ